MVRGPPRLIPTLDVSGEQMRRSCGACREAVQNHRSRSDDAEDTMVTKRRLGRMVLRVAGITAAVWFVCGVYLFVRQDYYLYLPDAEVPRIADVLPGGQEILTGTRDGLNIPAWFVAPSGPTPCAKAPAVLLFHGAGGNRSSLSPLARQLAKHGYAVLLVEYRGFGGAPGTPTEDGIAQDAEAANEWLRRRPSIDGERVFYVGYSLGTAVATRLAQTSPPRALVLQAPFTSIPDAAAEQYTIYPTRYLVRSQFATIERIGEVAAPVLVVAGNRDQVVPIDQSRAVSAAARDPRSMMELAGADHFDTRFAGHDPSYVDQLVRFFESAGPAPSCPRLIVNPV